MTTRRRATRPEALPPLDEPIYCLTIDLDWASDPCIETLVDDMSQLHIPLTVFATHRSPVVDRLAADPSIRVGIHPNFLPGSTHGSDIQSVVAHMRALFPDSTMSRSHCFYDSSPASEALHRAGIRFDANTHYYLEPDLRPHRHSSGIVRFPTFWGDSQAMRGTSGTPWDDTITRQRIGTSGLKILNVHPFSYAMNIRDPAHYRDIHHLIPVAGFDVIRSAASAEGARARVRAMIEGLDAGGACFTDLPTLYAAWQGGRWAGSALR